MSKIEDMLEKLAAPVCEQNGVYIYDTEYKKEGSTYFLRLYIDKDGGVTIDDCENVSRGINPLLDEHDFVKEAYTFEVSSPGLDRALKKPWHYEKVLGREIDVRLFAPTDLGKELSGVLKAYDNDSITLEIDGKEIILDKKKVSSARLAVKF